MNLDVYRFIEGGKRVGWVEGIKKKEKNDRDWNLAPMVEKET